MASSDLAQQMIHQHDAISNAIPVAQYKQICIQCEESSNIIVFLIDAYDAGGEVLSLAATVSNRFFVAIFDDLQSKNLSFKSVAAASFMIAMKLRERTQPLISDLARLTGSSQQQIRAAEKVILDALDWKVNITTGIRV